MKKVFAILLTVCMLISGIAVFAAEDVPASDADMVIEHEAQDDVMPISETTEEVPVADAEATEEAAAEEAEATETVEETEEVAIDYAAIAKDVIVIEGKKIAIAEDMGALAEKDGVIFIPVRVALEAAGYQVSWSEKEQMVMGANQATGAMFIMQVDNTLLFYLTADGQEGKLTMEAAPFKNEEEWRTYVPLKALASALGYKVGVDGEASDAVVALSK